MLDLVEARRLAERVGWLSQTPKSFAQMVLERAVLRSFGPKERIHTGGEEAGGIYGLVSGSLRASYALPDQALVFIHQFNPVSWIGEGTTIARQLRLGQITAARTATVLFLPRRAVDEIILSDRDHWRFFVMLTMQHLDTALGVVSDLMDRDHEKRFIATLMRLAGCRVSPPHFELPAVEASQEELATMANVSRNAAGAILRRLEAQRIIRLEYGKVIVVDHDILRQLLSVVSDEEQSDAPQRD